MIYLDMSYSEQARYFRRRRGGGDRARDVKCIERSKSCCDIGADYIGNPVT